MITHNSDDYVYDSEREIYKSLLKAEAAARTRGKIHENFRKAFPDRETESKQENAFPDPETSRKNDQLLLDGNWDDEYDNINPPHYKRGDIEVIDFIEDQGFNYNRGQVIRYLSRAGHKPNNPEIEDLKKALWYLEREVNNVENKENKNV